MKKKWQTSSTYLESMCLTILLWSGTISPPPGFVCVRRKLHTFGNERHTICCRLTPIVWRKNIVKGKDRPSQLIPKMHLDIRISFGIMLRMCKHIFYTGKSIVMNSGFCVTNGIVTLAVKGVAIITSKEVGNQLVPEVIK